MDAGQVKHGKDDDAKIAAAARARRWLRIPGIAAACLLALAAAAYAVGEGAGIAAAARTFLSGCLLAAGFSLFLLSAANILFDLALAVTGGFRARPFVWLAWIVLAALGIFASAAAMLLRRLAEGIR